MSDLMTPLVALHEIAYLTLIARRQHQLARAAAEKDEPYNDLGALSDLACGAKARLRYGEVPGGYTAYVTVELPRTPERDETERARTIAMEVVKRDVKLLDMGGTTDRIRYTFEACPSPSSSSPSTAPSSPPTE